MMKVMNRNHKWEEGDVAPVDMPEESSGVCKRPRCQRKGTIELLANGLCQHCWDSGAGNKSSGSNKSKGRPVKDDLPLIIIS